MTILIAPDKFKHSLSSLEACHAIKDGLLNYSGKFTVKLLPMSDGGDGLSEVINYYIAAAPHHISVTDPLFRRINSSFLISRDKETAFIEMAKASGLMLLKPEECDCKSTTTLGTGELIREAIRLKVKKIIIGIGGSATNDCGSGMATALGYRFLDSKGNELKPVGKNLHLISTIDHSNRADLRSVKFEVVCDVKNPLTGETGAVKVYAKQKGASRKDIALLETGMVHFAKIMRKELGKDVESVEGSGAAGGLGAGCIAFLNAELKSGINFILTHSKAEKYIKQADIIISGEGRFDAQSLNGKVISGLATLCKKHQKPLFVLSGSVSLSKQEYKKAGIQAAISINSGNASLETSLKNAKASLSKAACDLGEFILKPLPL